MIDTWIRRRTGAGRTFRRAAGALGAVALVLSLAAAVGADPSGVTAYTLTDLGEGSPGRINNQGQVAGTGGVAGTAGAFAFLYDGTGLHNLGALPGGQSSGAADVNEAGVVVGASGVPLASNPLGTTHAFLYDAAGMHDLGTLPGGTYSQASGINDAGQVVGQAYVNGQSHAFLYSAGVMQDLGAPSNGQSFATAINASGQVVGGTNYVDSAHLAHHGAFLYDGSGMHDLGTLGGYVSEADAINDAGQVAGTSVAADGITHVFLYDAAGMHDLGRLPGGTYHFVSDLNGLGQIVGGAAIPGMAPVHAFLYTGGSFYDLNNLLLPNAGVTLAAASGINDHGQIAARTTINGQSHAVLLTPVPAPVVQLEPATVSFPVQPLGVAGAPQTVRITNAGGLPLTIGSVGITEDPAGEFAIVADTGEATLEPGAARTIQVTFTPAAVASRTAALAISDNDPTAGSPHRLALSGTGAPEAPRDLTVQAVSPTELVLSWAASPLGATAYAVWRLNDTGIYARIAVVPPTVTRFADRGLKPGTAYSYRVRTIYFNVASGWSDAAGVTLQANPVAPTGLTAEVTSPSQITLTWTDNSSDENAFAVWRQDGSGDWHRVGVLAPHTTRFTDRELVSGTTYTYRVRATRGNQASDWTNEATAALLPAAPSNLAAIVVSRTEVDLSWTAGRGAETGMAIFRQIGSGDWQRIGVVAPQTTQYADRSAQPGTSNRYRVRTHTSTQVSAWSNEADVMPPGP